MFRQAAVKTREAKGETNSPSVTVSVYDPNLTHDNTWTLQKFTN